ncbi:MAG: radical SAM protein, partial [Nanoarchaeota archaeon]
MKKKDECRIFLISMPFDNVSFPSTYLASLKSYINSKNESIFVNIRQFNLDLLYLQNEVECFNRLALYGLDLRYGDLFFACLYCQEKKESIINLILDNKKNTSFERNEIEKFIDIIKKTTENLIHSINWREYSLAVFVCNFDQLFSSLYAARMIKKINPSIKTIFTGDLMFQEQGKYVLNEFHEVDFVISGENEESFYNLVISIINNENTKRYINCYNDRIDIENLPISDYDNFFEECKRLKFTPRSLPIFASRGCFYNKCTFCSRNRQNKHYKIKSISRLIEEIIKLKKKYPQIKSSLSFVDSMIPEIYLEALAKEIIKRKIEMSFFLELKANAKKETIKLLSKAGLKGAQIGIESFNQNILDRMNKGTTVKQNIETMKIMESLGINYYSNIIIEFPGVKREDILDNLRSLKKLKYYKPLKCVRLRYMRGSSEYERLIKSNLYEFPNYEMKKLIYPNLDNYEPFLFITPKRIDNAKEWRAIQSYSKKERSKERFS